MNKIAFAVENYKVTQDLIKFIDQKAGALIVVYGVIFTFLSKALGVLNIDKIIHAHNKVLAVISLFVGSMFIIFMFVQLYYIIFRIIKPRVRQDYQEAKSLVFFGHIANTDINEYVSKFSNLTDEEMVNEVTTQLHRISIIIDKKSRNLGIAINYLYVSFVMLFLYMILSSITVGIN